VGGTYREGNWPGMGGEVLLDGPPCTELIAGCYDPESNRWVGGYPSVNLIILVL
jgi:hypothetical protein